MMEKKAQAAMEYLVLTGFMMLILMVLLVAAYTRISDSEKQIDMDSAEKAVNRLTEAADFAYMHGHPTKLTISVYFPGDLDLSNSFISNNTIDLAVRVKGDTYTDVWRSTRGNVGWDLMGSSNLPTTKGYYNFVVETTDYESIYNGTVNIHR